MRKYENGEYKDMSAEEVAAIQQQEEEQPSLEERLEQLEALIAERGVK